MSMKGVRTREKSKRECQYVQSPQQKRIIRTQSKVKTAAQKITNLHKSKTPLF